MDKKLRAYICTGCGIGEALDTAKLCQVVQGEMKVPDCVTHAFLCGDEGRALLRVAVEQDGVNTLVVAGCSPRIMTDAFAFDPTKTIVERVNLREHVVWSHPARSEDTQMLAEDYLRMGIVKAQKSEPLEPNAAETSGTVLVIGGGLTGLTAAAAAADGGAEVLLCEKARALGGFAARLHRSYPTADPYRELEEPAVVRLISEIQQRRRVTVLTGAQVESITGEPGRFDVTITQGADRHTARVGAIVVATGFTPYDPTKLGHLGYGRFPNVITNVAMEELARAGRITRPSDGKEALRVAFIQCAGSRDQEHLSYCSAVCCRTSLKQALYVRERNADARAFIVYKDLRAPGEHELFYKRVQEDEGVFLTKGDVALVRENADHSVVLVADNTLLGQRVEIEADLVVLATGMVPATVGNPTLNLGYRKGKELPAGPHGFNDSEFVCFPYESERTGVYAAGCVRQPMDAMTIEQDAAGAALKAIQCTRSIARGAAVHPRSGDLSYPSFFLQRCTQCKRCTEECPFGSLDEDEKGTPKPNLNRCRRCGVCMGACPERIVSFKNYSVDMVASMIKAIEVPEEDEEKPRVVALMCENDAYPALDMAGARRLTHDPMFRVIPVRCLGSVNIVWIADALSKGIDGVMLIGCKFGDDYQCHFIKGSEIANKRLDNLKETLTRLALEADRVKVVQLAISDFDRLPAIFGEFADTIRAIGPNPYKGF
ncbi:MAG TPA: hydrogenase iron-sulfur subunit [Polyangia bacterium]|jgi:quinone-modifying oxidoreductase subunit QmoB